jgi:hypothetical protein
MITQALLDNLKSQLTSDELLELKEQFGIHHPSDRYRWHRMWKVSPKVKRFDMGLVRAAKDMIKHRHHRESVKVESLIAEVEQILQLESQSVES